MRLKTFSAVTGSELGRKVFAMGCLLKVCGAEWHTGMAYCLERETSGVMKRSISFFFKVESYCIFV